MPRYIVLLGPPGAGKGTQARRISQALELVHVSSGDIFRENLKNNTELGETARGFIERGELVPDDVTIAMIRERLSRKDCSNGALLDGFPRTLNQAIELDKMLAELGGTVEAVPYIDVPEDVLVERLSGRWTCKAHGHIFHEKFNSPKEPGICDFDGSELYQRPDDNVETVKQRIQVYTEQTAPLIDYYRKAGKLIDIDGAQSIDDVSADLIALLTKDE